ncbi:MAG: NAD(P)/FAD-dependent oxidoreductase [Candidatus Micrarchaeaceae archaeon]
MRKEVYIVGGGTSGLILARELGKRGISATVFESDKKIGSKSDKASGILSASGLKRLGIGFSSSIVNELYGALFYAGKKKLHVRSNKLQAYVLDRVRLAEICAHEAKEAGANIVTGKKVDKETLDRLSENGSIIVGADGALSAVARWKGFPDTAQRILTFKEVYENSNYESSDEVSLFFSKRFSDGFFGWAAPYGNSVVELGVGTRSGSWNSKIAIERMKSEHVVHRFIEGAKLSSAKASIIPIGTRKYTAKDNVLLVGDAAGQVKATTGGGIIFGGACAIVAADAIEKNIAKGTPLEIYDKMWRALYGMDLYMHRALYSYYSKSSDKGIEMALWLADILGVGNFLGKYGDMDRLSLMLKRFFLRGLSE